MSAFLVPEVVFVDSYCDYHTKEEWSYQWLMNQLDEEWHFPESLFDEFMQEIKDGARCATCGQTTDTLIDDPEGTVCGNCGQNWRWI